MTKWMACLLACSVIAVAQTTVTGTITDAGGTRLNGSCTIQAVGQFKAATGWQVVGSPYTVPFTAGAFSVSLVPTDTATPAGYYKMACVARLASGGTYNWGPKILLIPTSALAVDISDVTITSPPGNSYQVQASQIAQSSAQLGEALLWNGTLWAPGNAGSSYSIDLIQPQLSDSGMLQKTDDRLAYAITAVSCSTDVGTVTVQLDVRTAAAPNVAGANVLGTALVCTATGTASAAVSPAVQVAAGSPVALQMLAVSGSPGIVRVHVSR
jgi:hypothetical protein